LDARPQSASSRAGPSGVRFPLRMKVKSVWTSGTFLCTMLGGAGDPELKSRIWGLFLPRCLVLAGRRDARPGGGARTLLSRGSEVPYEPPVRLLGLGSDLPLQPPMGWVAKTRALLRWLEPGRGRPLPPVRYQITRASSANASARRADGRTSVPRS